jgi:hypothetical protein
VDRISVRSHFFSSLSSKRKNKRNRSSHKHTSAISPFALVMLPPVLLSGRWPAVGQSRSLAMLLP